MENLHEFIEEFRNLVNSMSSEEYDNLIAGAMADLKVMSATHYKRLNIYLPDLSDIEHSATAMTSVTIVTKEYNPYLKNQSPMMASSVADLSDQQEDKKYAFAG